MSRNVLAFDFGASGGRAMLGCFSDGKIILRQVHRFENRPVDLGETLYWDVTNLFGHIKRGIKAALSSGGFESIGIDTWGVDFAFIGKDGKLIEAPVHYRDKRTRDVFDYAFKNISRGEFYDLTGNQIMEINTVFQLMTVIKDRPSMIELADKMLLMPDLFNYMLTGAMYADRSIASTTQMMDIHRLRWAYGLIEKAGIPRRILPEMIPSGKEIGRLKEDICTELNTEPAKVIAVCGHDTQCAAAAVPAAEDEYMFLSCGTWSLFGIVRDIPIVSEMSYNMNITNEVGYGDKITFLKNIIGLWLIQETRRQWHKEGFDIDFAEMTKIASESAPFRCFIDPNAPEFVPPGDIPSRIRDFCRRTGQYVPKSRGEIVRCIYESLALSFRKSYDEIYACTRRFYKKIYIVGGGCKAEILCQMTADACACEVSAGPSEATAYGNAAIQLITLGEISSARDAAKIIAASDEIKIYQPHNSENWKKAYAAFGKIVGK